MPLPRWIARLNRRFTNRAMLLLVRRPPFAALTHRGRVSGRSYRIPLNAFPCRSGFVFALTYGPAADWVRNVLAVGSAQLEYGGETVELVDPELVGSEAVRPCLPAMVTPLLRLLGVDQFLLMDRRADQAAR